MITFPRFLASRPERHARCYAIRRYLRCCTAGALPCDAGAPRDAAATPALTPRLRRVTRRRTRRRAMLRRLPISTGRSFHQALSISASAIVDVARSSTGRRRGFIVEAKSATRLKMLRARLLSFGRAAYLSLAATIPRFLSEAPFREPIRRFVKMFLRQHKLRDGLPPRL